MKQYTLNEAWAVIKTEMEQNVGQYFVPVKRLPVSESIYPPGKYPLVTLVELILAWRDNYAKLSANQQSAYDRIQKESNLFDLPVKSKESK
jgi:hypothetical protein